MTEYCARTLPVEISRLCKSFSRLAGYEVDLGPDEQEEADMVSEWHGREPKIFFSCYSDAGVARELIHLKLDLRGYPVPMVSVKAQYALTGDFCHQLLRRSMSFPVVRKMGYEPEVGGRHWVSRWQGTLARESQVVGDAGEAAFDVLVALHLAHAHRFCGMSRESTDLAPFDHDERYQRARLLAGHLDQAIDLQAGSTAIQYRQNLTRCIEILGLVGQVEMLDAREHARNR